MKYQDRMQKLANGTDTARWALDKILELEEQLEEAMEIIEDCGIDFDEIVNARREDND